MSEGERSPRYRLIEHTADLAIIVDGQTLPDLLANLAYAICDLMVEAGTVERRVSVDLSVEADDLDMLVVDWANEILYRASAERLLLPEVDRLKVNDRSVRARGHGEPLDAKRHHWKTELKAATYHDLRIDRRPDGSLTVQMVLDV
jgi:SHS2 domain-containing protein